MLVQRVLMPVSSLESWTVLGDDGVPVEPVERYLAYLTDIERSPNTIKAYAHDLKDWLVFLDQRALDWREVRLEDLGEFVAWLRLPPSGRDGRVALLPSAGHHCGTTTVNRKLSAVSSFCVFHARHGVDLGDLVTELQPVRQRRSGWKPFLYHLSGAEPERRRTIKLKTPRQHPKLLRRAHAHGGPPPRSPPAPPPPAGRRPGPGRPRRLRPAAGPVPAVGFGGQRRQDRRGAGAPSRRPGGCRAGKIGRA